MTETIIICAHCEEEITITPDQDGPLYRGIGEIRMDCPHCGKQYTVQQANHKPTR